MPRGGWKKERGPGHRGKQSTAPDPAMRKHITYAPFRAARMPWAKRRPVPGRSVRLEARAPAETSAAPVPSEIVEMKRRQLIAGLATAVLAAGMWVQPTQGEIGISIGIGDQPYYEGPVYWDAGYEWVWVPGFNRHGHWVHGHYKKHGRFQKEHANEHHQHRHHD